MHPALKTRLALKTGLAAVPLSVGLFSHVTPVRMCCFGQLAVVQCQLLCSTCAQQAALALVLVCERTLWICAGQNVMRMPTHASV